MLQTFLIHVGNIRSKILSLCSLVNLYRICRYKCLHTMGQKTNSEVLQLPNLGHSII
uniref:Uncharacterized protein n=1 Tax=Babesia bovis TaxID=5865 RepID=S6BKI6_BABBO|nr:hypothetical protein [Babesia bovis]